MGTGLYRVGDILIYIDTAEGSRELYQSFKPHEAELINLGFADIAFEGNTANGSGVIGIEYKKVNELVGSILSERLVCEQIPKLCQAVDVAYLLIEGYVRKDYRSSTLITLFGKTWQPYKYSSMVDYDRIYGTLLTMTEKCGVRVLFAGNKHDTVTQLRSLARWWSRSWKAHNSNIGFYMGISGRQYGRVSLATKYATQLPGIGEEKAKWIGEYWGLKKFNEVVESLDRKAWEQVPGISERTSLRIINYLKGEL
jgi:ERCC4-type nuclease